MKIKDITIFFFTSALALSSCSKDPIVPVSETNRIDTGQPVFSAVSQNSVAVNSVVSSNQSDQIQDKGVCWGTANNPTITGLRQSGGKGSGAFSNTLTGLLPGTTYYLRTYVQTVNEILYSNNQSFRTLDYQLASVQTTSVSSITQTDAVGNANVSASGGGTVSQRGLCWSTSQLPTIANSKTLSGSGIGSFSVSITGLIPGTTYYLRAYGTNQAGTSYGNQIIFTTQPIRLATISAVSASNITRNSASLTASVSADGGGTITSRGIVYSSSTSAPVINSSSMVNNGAGIGVAGGTVSGLTSMVTYYVRAYAVNAAGVSYGSVTTFRTL